LGIGDWGLGIGDWAQSPIPNPQSPLDLILISYNSNLLFNYLINNVMKKIYKFINYND
jgi:hypothetical protein